MTGIYIHVPFCASKCPYCDFYSLTGQPEAVKDAYVQAVLRAMDRFAGESADTVYFGGGTPSLLGGDRLAALVEGVRRRFLLTADAEITLEANPGDPLTDTAAAFRDAGGNRVSLGVQAVDDDHLRALGRRHTAAQAAQAITGLRQMGFDNLSVDLMLGTPGQTAAHVREAVDRFADWGVAHVSAYLLKLEPGTPFGEQPPVLPDEDDTVMLYRTAAEALERAGFAQYEISNFARPGRESRHNLKYWNSDPYVGFGPAAHSFFGGRRWAYPRSLEAFLAGAEPVMEAADTVIAENSPDEYAMLRLRLTEGLTEAGFCHRFGSPIPNEWRRRAAGLPARLVAVNNRGIRLTREGFLVSDAVIARILWE